MDEARISMSQHERDRLLVLRNVAAKRLSFQEAAHQLDLSLRQVRRLLRRLEAEGDRAVVHHGRGKASNRKLRAAFQAQVLKRVAESFADFGPTLACEHLAREGLIVGRETLRKWLIAKGTHRPKKRVVEACHPWRERRSCFGELVMLDGSEHAWLEDRGPKAHLIALIDDATNRFWGYFTESDCTETNFVALEGWLRQFGRPQALYTDRNSIYTVNRPATQDEQLADQPARTQFRRALDELDIRLILAHSPQAKGRIERLFGTLQDRLVKELRVAGVRTLEAANRFLNEVFLPTMWPAFTVVPAKAVDAHRPLEPAQRLEEVFSIRTFRTVAQDLTVSYGGQTLGVSREDACVGLKGARVEVEERRDGSRWLLYQGQYRALKACPKPTKAALPAKPSTAPKAPPKPSPEHPWRKFSFGKALESRP